MRRTTSLSPALVILAVAAFLLIFSGPAMAQKLTIMHTNDMHSKLLASPNADYTPLIADGDATIGGIARIATKVDEVRAAMAVEGTPVLLLDGGDFTMGTLFHLLLGEAEMGVMNHLGYDATTLGNHEYDLLPTGTASIVSHRGSIRVLATNLEVLDAGDPWGAAIQALILSGDILPWTTQDADGIKVGYFGILGDGAWEDVNKPYGEEEYPLGMRDRFEAAAEAVDQLRNVDGVDIVICLSHSGVNEPGPPWTGEDVDLAEQVPGIDVIISGHTHTLIPTPVTVGKTTIVQAKSYTSRLGVLELEYDSEGEKWDVLSYDSVVIDDSIPGDSATQALVDGYIAQVDSDVLAPDYAFSDTIVQTDFDVTGTYAVEHGLGNLVTDAILWSANQVLPPGDKAIAAAESDGVIRSNILAGTTGEVHTSDAFEVLPLGVDPLSGEGGYPLVSFCLSGKEMYHAAWVDSLAPLLNDTDFWISWSGIGFQYINFRPPLDMWRCLDPEDPSCSSRVPIINSTGVLYRVALNYYVASNIARTEDLSYGLIKIVPKECDTGAPLASLTDAILYKAPGEPLIQWEGFFDYLATLPDTDDPPDGIPNIPERYAGPEGRIVKACVVATVSYGSPFDEKVSLLRDFRDRFLLKSAMGRKFVDFYYTYGSAVATAVAPHEWLKGMIRILLLPLVGVAKLVLWLI